jgi:sugar phosphate isomerase/epimerase
MYSRRELGRLALAGVAVSSLGAPILTGAASAQARIDSTFNGVRLGMGTGSLNPLPPTPAGGDVIDTVIKSCVECGMGYIELVNGLVEPTFAGIGGGGRIPDPLTPDWIANRPKLRDWRINAPISRFQEIKRKFDAAGLTLISYVMTFTSDFSMEEMEAVFRHADALGVEVITTNQSQVSTGRRLVPFAAKYRAKPSWHNHARTDDWDEVASLESFDELLSMSPDFKINLDIGHFTAGNQDSVAFLQKHHARVSHIHVKDRRRNNGPNQPWGQGDTPIIPVLQLIKQNRWPIYVIQEREYRGPEVGDPVSEVRKNIAYMRQALA